MKQIITLGRKDLLPFVKIKTVVDPVLLLNCVLASGVPFKDIKTIKAKVLDTTTSNWESFDILTRGGAVIQEIQGEYRADYSPTIREMIQEGKLFR